MNPGKEMGGLFLLKRSLNETPGKLGLRTHGSGCNYDILGNQNPGLPVAHKQQMLQKR